MGIKGLWKALNPYVHDGHLSQFRGQRIGVDMYVWLHRVLRDNVDINLEVVQSYFERRHARRMMMKPDEDVGDSTTEEINIDDVIVIKEGYIAAVVQRVDALQRHGVVPVCVFDGAEMPMKERTDDGRQQRRDDAFGECLRMLEEMYLNQGQQLFRGCRGFEEAVSFLEKAVDISPELAHVVLRVLKEERHVECIVAPYEADAELAYLCREGYTQAAVSEDSDLIAYYCPVVIAKLEPFTGKCAVLKPADSAPRFFEVMAAATVPRAKQLFVCGANANGASSTTMHLTPITAEVSSSRSDLTTQQQQQQPFTYESFLLGCIMSGCDYVANLPQVGIKTAFKYVTRSASMKQLMELMQVSGGFPPEEIARYRRLLLEAFYCFAHHLVYCPFRKTLVHYRGLPREEDGGQRRTQLIGEMWAADVSRKVCEECLYNPTTLMLYEGKYESCLRRYLQRARGGQSSLQHFTAFQHFTHNKVVIRQNPVQVGVDRTNSTCAATKHRRSDDDAVDDDAEALSHVQKKVCQAQGFLGSRPVSHGATRVERRIIRSKFFLRGCAEVERWSSSDAEDDVMPNSETNSTSSPSAGTTTHHSDAPSSLMGQAVDLSSQLSSSTEDIASPLSSSVATLMSTPEEAKAAACGTAHSEAVSPVDGGSSPREVGRSASAAILFARCLHVPGRVSSASSSPSLCTQNGESRPTSAPPGSFCPPRSRVVPVGGLPHQHNDSPPSSSSSASTLGISSSIFSQLAFTGAAKRRI